jgi:alkylhydroperoxidase/carboxymuconolactone decarboxylase family protein YurZ
LTTLFDWTVYQKQTTVTLADMAKISPDVDRGYRTLSEAGVKARNLNPKTRELIALAVPVTRQRERV